MERRYAAVLQPLCVWLVVWCLSGCGADKSANLTDSTDEDSSILLNSGDGIPQMPRRRLVQEFDWYKKRNVTVGMETSFAGSTFAVQTEVEFWQSYAVMVWLFAPGEDDALVNEGSVFLNNSPEREFVYLCRYMGYYEAAPKVRGKISIFGSGVSEERALRERSAVVQSSEIFPVKLGASWKTIYQHCLDYGERKKYRQSIDRDLQAMTKGMIYHDEQSECVQASHCTDWHASLLPGVSAHTAPACVKRSNGARYCAIRGKPGTACSLYDDNGNRLTPGFFEYPCQTGTTCRATKEGGWFRNWSIYSSWEAECKKN